MFPESESFSHALSSAATCTAMTCLAVCIAAILGRSLAGSRLARWFRRLGLAGKSILLAALGGFLQPIVFNYEDGPIVPGTNMPLYAGCSLAEAQAAFEQVAAEVQAELRLLANVVVVGNDATVPQPHKTIAIHECGHALGLVPSVAMSEGKHNHCACGWHRMDSGSNSFVPMHYDPCHALEWLPCNSDFLEFLLGW